MTQPIRLTFTVRPGLLTLLHADARRRQLSVDALLNQVLDLYYRDLLARTSGLQHEPEPPRPADRSLTIVTEPPA